jgi:hypothetical protein
VRIRVEYSVDEHLLQVGAKQFLTELGSVDVQPGERRELRDFAAADVLHRQDTLGGVIHHWLRHLDFGKFLQIFTDGDQVLRFALVVQLVLDREVELLDHRAEAVALADLGVGIERQRQFGEHLEIFLDHRPDVRTLNFHDDRAAVAELRAMHLAERGGGNRLALEFRERLGDARAELLLDDFFHLFIGERLHVVLQAGQRGAVRVRHQVRAARKHLAELHVRRPHRLEIVDQLIRRHAGFPFWFLRGLFRAVAVFPGAVFLDFLHLDRGTLEVRIVDVLLVRLVLGFLFFDIDPHLLHEIGAAVFPEKAGDLFVAS